MAAGISQQAKRGINRRWLYKIEAQCRQLFPNAAVQRFGERHVTVHKPKDLEQGYYADALRISLSWGSMSNGETVGTACLNSRWPGYGDFTEHLKAAYTAL